MALVVASTAACATTPQARVHSRAPAAVRDTLQLGATLTDKTKPTRSLPLPLLRSTVAFLNISLDSQGTGDPEPRPGVFDWRSLDARMAQITPVLRADPRLAVDMRVYAAPPWMESSCSTPGCKVAVRPRYDGAFAQLVVAAARRYPEIHYYVVWNEFDGYDNARPWSARAYTDMYNVVYSALKADHSTLQVGGPYAPFLASHDGWGPGGLLNPRATAAFSYWLQHKKGADFLAVDGRTAPPGVTPTQPVTSTALFTDVTRWIARQPGSQHLPIWWMEWYARSNSLPAAEWDAVSAYTLLELAYSGAANAFLWDAEDNGHPVTTPGLWNGGDGQGTALAPVFATLTQELYGTDVTLSSPDPGVELLTNGSALVAIDVSATPRTADVLGRRLRLAAWQIVVR
jgi:hypothetical protein